MNKYEKVYIDLKKNIESNYYKDGKLPAEKDLQVLYNCSRQTIKTAMNILLEDGTIFRRKGKGTFIRKNFFNHKEEVSNMYINRDKKIGIYNKTIILKFEIILCTDLVAKNLNLSKPENVYHFKRLRYIDGVPETLEDTYIPVKLLPSLKESDLEESILQYINSNLKFNIESTHKKFILQRPSDDIKKNLKVNDNDYIVLAEEFITLEDGSTIAWGNVYYSPRKFEFSSIITAKSHLLVNK